jgi:hypothetical protein
MVDRDAIRIAEVYRLHLGGASLDEIFDQLKGDFVGVPDDKVHARIEADLAIVFRLQEEYQDPEKVRMSLTLDLDSVFASIMTELNGAWLSRQSNAKALFYREAREVLLQKALLYGLNTQNLNVSQKSKLFTVIQQLRADATQLETEANYPALPEPSDFSTAITADTGLLVESNSDYGR